MTVKELVEHHWNPGDDLRLRCIAGNAGLRNEILELNINRPGLALTGYNIEFGSDRIQMFGRGETRYLENLASTGEHDSIIKFFERKVPCTLFTTGLAPPEFFLQLANKYECPVLQTNVPSSAALQRLSRALSTFNVPSMLIHAVLVEVFGLGVLLLGESGVGKSELALELIERGHLLISDDVVQVFLDSGKFLVGRPAKPELGYHMEIRGLGIINIPLLFGVGSIKSQKSIDLAIELEIWQEGKEYDRIGSADETVVYFDVPLPKVVIPIRPGRSITVIIETAVRNMRLRSIGYHAVEEFKKLVHKSLVSSDKQPEK